MHAVRGQRRQRHARPPPAAAAPLRGAIVVRSAGGLQFHARLPRPVVEPREYPLRLVSAQHVLLCDGEPAAHRNHQEQVECVGAEAFGEFHQPRYLAGVEPRSSGVDLSGNTGLLEKTKPPNGAFEGARNPPEPVVRFGARAIETHRHALDTGRPDALGHGLVDQGPVRGETHPQIPGGGVTGDLENVPPPKRLAAAEH